MNNNLSEKQLIAIDMLVNGMSYKDTAHEIGIELNSLYRWKGTKEFKDELAKQQKEYKENIDRIILKYSNTIVNKIYDLAVNAKSEKVRLDAAIYLINRVAGTPTNVSKVENKDVSETKKETKKEISWNDLKKAAKNGNIINL